MKSILIIEDDPKIAELIKLYTEQEGFRTLIAENGLEGLELAKNTKPDLVLLDQMLPGMAGAEVLKALRQHTEIPVIMVTAKSEELDKILGLELGADDYITKPFSPKELIARVKTVLRRAKGVGPLGTRTLKVADLHIDPAKLSVSRGSEEMELSPLEFRLLNTLAKQPGIVLSREQLMEAIYESSNHLVFDRTIDGHIKKLRKKLGDNPKTPRYIESVHGAGYKFKAQ